MRLSVQAYRQDVEQISLPAGHVTMNWQVLQSSVSTRGAARLDPMTGLDRCAGARRRLRALEAMMTADDLEFLHRLAIVEVSKSALATCSGLRVGLVEAKARAMLRELSRVYN